MSASIGAVTEEELAEWERLDAMALQAEDAAEEDGRDRGAGRIILDEQNDLLNAIEDGAMQRLIAEVRRLREQVKDIAANYIRSKERVRVLTEALLDIAHPKMETGMGPSEIARAALERR